MAALYLALRGWVAFFFYISHLAQPHTIPSAGNRWIRCGGAGASIQGIKRQMGAKPPNWVYAERGIASGIGIICGNSAPEISYHLAKIRGAIPR